MATQAHGCPAQARSAQEYQVHKERMQTRSIDHKHLFALLAVAGALSGCGLSVNGTAAPLASGGTSQGGGASGGSSAPATSIKVTPINGLAFYSQIIHTPSTPQTLVITNSDPQSAITLDAISGNAEFPMKSDCPIASGGTLGPRAHCTASISFEPSGTGARKATLTIQQHAATALGVPLSGTGIAGDTGVRVTVTPSTSCVLPGAQTQFAATVANSTSTTLNWFVDGVPGGNSSVGIITSDGLYFAPSKNGRHTIQATQQSSPKASGSTNTQVTSSPSLAIYPSSAAVLDGAQQQFQPQVCSVPTQDAAVWSVDGIVGGSPAAGTVSSNGLYTAPNTNGMHTLQMNDSVLGQTSHATVNVFSGISVDFGSRSVTTHPIPTDLLGAGRGEALHNSSDASLLTTAGVTTTRLYANIENVYATRTPDWTKIDPTIVMIQKAGLHVILQMAHTPVWLQPTPAPCSNPTAGAVPTDLIGWGHIAASYVAHMDSAFPGVVQDYEIGNEPDSNLCATDRISAYLSIYSAAAPMMKQQAAADHTTIRVGGPALAAPSNTNWITALTTTTSTAPYVDFISYHDYLFGAGDVLFLWDSYNGSSSVYQETQDASNGLAARYSAIQNAMHSATSPSGRTVPIYIDEFNLDYAFAKNCCSNDAVYGPVWNALAVGDTLNTIYSGALDVPAKLVYFAANAYPYLCLIGVPDVNSDCLYSRGATPTPYPQYYTYQLVGSTEYLGLSLGGYMAVSISPPTSASGIVVSGFYTASQDSVLIVNPTHNNYEHLRIDLDNPGIDRDEATMYNVTGTSIATSSVTLVPSSAGDSTTIDVPPLSVVGIAIRAE
jgi:hypothetical protein